MNGTLKKALRWIALPAMLVVLLTCSAFAAFVEDTTVTGAYNAETKTTAVTVKFTFGGNQDAGAPMADAYLDWGTEAERSGDYAGSVTYKDGTGGSGTLTALAGKAVSADEYVELTLNIKAEDSVKIADSTVYVNDGTQAEVNGHGVWKDADGNEYYTIPSGTKIAVNITSTAVIENASEITTIEALTVSENMKVNPETFMTYTLDENGKYISDDDGESELSGDLTTENNVYVQGEEESATYYSVVTLKTNKTVSKESNQLVNEVVESAGEVYDKEKNPIPYIYVRCGSLKADKDAYADIEDGGYGRVVRLDVTALPYNTDGGAPTISYTTFLVGSAVTEEDGEAGTVAITT